MAHLIVDDDDDDLDAGCFSEFLKEIINKLKIFQKRIEAALCLFLVHLAYICDQPRKEPHNSADNVDACLAVYRKMAKFCVIKKSNFNPSEFTTVVKIRFFVVWRLADVLLEMRFNEYIRPFQKSKGIALLSLLTSKPVFEKNRILVILKSVLTTLKSLAEVLNVADKRVVGAALLTLIQKLMNINASYSLKDLLFSINKEVFKVL